MCGIVGYTGRGDCVPFLLEGLKKLEYRGYDSAGISVLGTEEELRTIKAAGKLSVLKDLVDIVKPGGNTGIGHTRWATHGKPSDENAHPHSGGSGRVSVVHNGIIENYLGLKEELERDGGVFISDTDTEIIAHLIETYYDNSLHEAVKKAVARMEGSYALAVLAADEPDRIVAVRKDSPLVIGLGEGENFLASDIPAFLAGTREWLILEDGETAVIEPDRVEIYDSDGSAVLKDRVHVDWDAEAAEKGGYEHFMLKEIHEQPAVFRKVLSGRITEKGVNPGFEMTAEQVLAFRNVFFVACGTAYHAGLACRGILEKTLKIPVRAEVASEFRYGEPLVDSGSLVIVVSQSGETADTLAALRLARGSGAAVVAVTNVVGSSIAREADYVMYTYAGPEISVASTKAYTSMLVCGYLLTCYLGMQAGRMDRTEAFRIIDSLTDLPGKAAAVLAKTDMYVSEGKFLAGASDIFFIGRGLDYAVALEGSLKLKEISYIHAEAYPAGELKHGTLALITEKTPVIALCTQRRTYEKTLSNIKEVKARGAFVIAVAYEDDPEIGKYVDKVIRISAGVDETASVLAAIPLQLLAYYTAGARGENIDQPRNLAKSVTVE